MGWLMQVPELVHSKCPGGLGGLGGFLLSFPTALSYSVTPERPMSEEMKGESWRVTIGKVNHLSHLKPPHAGCTVPIAMTEKKESATYPTSDKAFGYFAAHGEEWG